MKYQHSFMECIQNQRAVNVTDWFQLSNHNDNSSVGMLMDVFKETRVKEDISLILRIFKRLLNAQDNTE